MSSLSFFIEVSETLGHEYHRYPSCCRRPAFSARHLFSSSWHAVKSARSFSTVFHNGSLADASKLPDTIDDCGGLGASAMDDENDDESATLTLESRGGPSPGGAPWLPPPPPPPLPPPGCPNDKVSAGPDADDNESPQGLKVSVAGGHDWPIALPPPPPPPPPPLPPMPLIPPPPGTPPVAPRPGDEFGLWPEE